MSLPLPEYIIDRKFGGLKSRQSHVQGVDLVALEYLPIYPLAHVTGSITTMLDIETPASPLYFGKQDK